MGQEAASVNASAMKSVKDTKRATVHVGFDGRVHKHFHGAFALERFQNEVRILRYLEDHGCTFVPRVLGADENDLYLITSNCGTIVESISDEKLRGLFAELEQYGVHHGDPFARNVTYHRQLGRFAIIDFEFATIIESGEGLTIEELERRAKES